MSYKLLNGDCLELMRQMPAASVDLILCDLPYGTTSCSWDSVIPLNELWVEYKRVRKLNTAIVLTCNQPFTTTLIASNLREFKYSQVWIKTAVTGFANAKKQPLRQFEDVAVFYQSQPTYNPQGVIELKTARCRGDATGGFMGKTGFKDGYVQTHGNYPKNIICADSERGHHPTQKPVALMEYLIKTYSNAGDTVLDNTMGSGTTGVACMNTDRLFVGIERDENYFNIATTRIEAAYFSRLESLCK